jgi:lysophospholipase L1-like esterase
VGVRIEVVGDAEAVDLAYRTSNGNLGYRGDGAGITFSVWRAGHQICEEDALLGDGVVRLSLGPGPSDKPATIYLPEGMQPLVQSISPVNGEIHPGPPQPKWIAYGDSITQGWIASGPSRAWTAIAARKAGLDLVNLGYAGAARGEIVSAEHVAELDADLITVAYGVNCWSRTPHSVGMISEGLDGFLDIVRRSHPRTPIIVVTPVIWPDAEDMPNKLGATLDQLRAALESVASRRMDADPGLSLIDGKRILTAEHLDDGIHPGDEGHKRISAAVVKVLTSALKAAGARRSMAEDGAAQASESVDLDPKDADSATGTEAATGGATRDVAHVGAEDAGTSGQTA